MTSKVFSEAGYWYFWDEALTHRYGPFDTQEQAEINLILYVYKLNGFSNIKTVEEYIHRLECVTVGKQMPLKEQECMPKYTTVEGHPIEVGQWYEARGPGKVEVVAVVPRKPHPVIGVSEDGFGMLSFTASGRHCGNHDLMRPCDPPDKHIDYPWADFPLAKWAFTNKNGLVEFATGLKPQHNIDGWRTYRGSRWKHPTYRREGADAATSLRKRPEGV